MKKTLLSLGLIAAVGSPFAYAENGVGASIVELNDEQVASLADASELDSQSLEAIAPPGRGRGGRGGWNRGRGRGGIRFPIPFPFPFPQQRSCYARDGYGQTFQAYGSGNRRYIQNVALQACYQQSYAPRTCRAIGCN